MTALSVSQLKKIYANGTMALKGIDLEVKEGDFFALLGQNGAGKSTTISIICSLVRKSSGKIKVFGYDMDTELTQAKTCIGVVPQEINFSPFEKISHILINQAGYYGIPQKTAQTRMQHYLKKMDLWEMREQPALRLSGGMKRRLMIARAMMNEPRLLILDEPTAGVDVELRHSLWDFLSQLNQQGTTIILTTHYLEEAEQLCKHVAIIDGGCIIENTNMKTLIQQTSAQTIQLEIASALPASFSLHGYSYQLLEAHSLEVTIKKGQSLNELILALHQQQLIITSMRNKTNRLEELFMRLIKANKEGNP